MKTLAVTLLLGIALIASFAAARRCDADVSSLRTGSMTLSGCKAPLRAINYTPGALDTYLSASQAHLLMTVGAAR